MTLALYLAPDRPPRIDWSQPWLAPYRLHGERVWARWAQGVSVADALNEQLSGVVAWSTLCAGQLRFVSQDDLPHGQAYETFIFTTHRIPARNNLHDFFNGLVWLVFPGIKQCLNARHVAHLGRSVDSMKVGRRGAVRDALTLFDENAAFLQGPAVLQEALRRRDWTTLFKTERRLWSACQLTLFGHALLEKLCLPRKGITAHVWLVPEGARDVMAVCEQLQDEPLQHKSWRPLPVLGVPGWWAANELDEFYDDDTVFRGCRVRAQMSFDRAAIKPAGYDDEK